VLRAQLAKLETKAGELAAMQTYLHAKIAWLKGGETGAPPEFEIFAAGRSPADA
jgi:MerR family copper efflux transcriptional regulator